MAGDMKLVPVLLVIIGALLVSAILVSQQDTITQQIYAQNAHEVTLLNGSSVVTPAPFLSPELQVKIWSLAPIGVWIGAGVGIFLMFFGRKK